MFRFLASVRKMICISVVLGLTALGGLGHAELADLEGTQGHALDGLSALEGTAGHAAAGGQPVDDGIVCQPGAPCHAP